MGRGPSGLREPGPARRRGGSGRAEGGARPGSPRSAYLDVDLDLDQGGLNVFRRKMLNTAANLDADEEEGVELRTKEKGKALAMRATKEHSQRVDS